MSFATTTSLPFVREYSQVERVRSLSPYLAVTPVSLYVYTIITNKVVIGFNQRKVAFIITYRTYEVCDAVISKVGRGATIINGIGAYTRTPKQIVMVAVNLHLLCRRR